ncbi:hypothetical protein [Vibrio splendidus]|uniref:hypothetical protein n=1 Tax=Vibrio splendidus TaxID=29497 RepID=UPI003D0E9B90
MNQFELYWVDDFSIVGPSKGLQMSFVQNINPNLRLLEFQSWRWEAHGEKVTIVKLENYIPFLGFDYSRGAILLSDGSNTPMRETTRTDSHIGYERMLVNTSSLQLDWT